MTIKINPRKYNVVYWPKQNNFQFSELTFGELHNIMRNDEFIAAILKKI